MIAIGNNKFLGGSWMLKKKRKGLKTTSRAFTLVELLAIIVILGIILVIAVPGINHIMDSSKTKLYNVTVDKIISGAKDYILQNKEEITGLEETGIGYIPLSEIMEKQFISDAITNPITKEPFPENAVVKATKSGENYEYDFLIDGIPNIYVESKGVNSPKLAKGMTAIKWNGSTWAEVSNPDEDLSWYDYPNKVWGNAKTADGSYWVWVPRYAYQISSNYHTSTAGTINIKFLRNNSNVAGDDTTVSLEPTYSGNSQTNYIKHPAFTFGNVELTGLWIAKFTATAAEGVDEAIPCNGANNISTKTPKIIPNAVAWHCVSVHNMFLASRKMETNNVYGWGTSGSGIDTHMMKNSEWGAAAYLSKSTYGKENERIWINPNSWVITGCAGDSESALYTYMSTCLREYHTTNGQKASTTGNVYGIYDMSGATWEHVAAFTNNMHASVNGSSIVNAENKYKDVYNIGSPDNGLNNYALTSNVKGDAIYETSSGGQGWDAWYATHAWFVYDQLPWVVRGADFEGGLSASQFAYSRFSGSATLFAGFRPVLVVY